MNTAAASRQEKLELCLGAAGTPVGTLTWARQGRRSYSAIRYHDGWLERPERFNVSADLTLQPGHQHHKARSAHDSVFHGALADTMPDAWGQRVIRRDHAKRRKADPDLPALEALDYLLAVDDFSRVGALRLRDADGTWLRSPGKTSRHTRPRIDLGKVLQASHALELGRETAADLRFLQGNGTSLGGMRPKCTMIDTDGALAIGKFPSVHDERSVTRGEVLALQLARKAGIHAANARINMIDDSPVAIIGRFDRDSRGGRIPYQSAATMLQTTRHSDSSYFEIADAIRAHSAAPTNDLHELWRRILYNLLITNIDDHLQNHGFLHVGHGLWRLAPAFDVNPFPDKNRESKTWLSEVDGPVTDVATLLARCNYFALSRPQANGILAEAYTAVSQWREAAGNPIIGMTNRDIDNVAPAFEHAQTAAARNILRA